MLGSSTALLAACRGSGSGDNRTVQQPPEPDGTVLVQKASPTPRATPTPRPEQICLVTKQVSIPAAYVPPDLVTLPPDACVKPGERMRKAAADALLKLFAGAAADGINLLALSGYRSYQEQQDVLAQEIKAYGEAQARLQVAEPGHSEHQLGVAMDVTSARHPYDLEASFGQDPEGLWVARNAARYGFVISYPADKEAITGYVYEPWHIRYVGVDLAQAVVASGKSLTEYLPARGVAGCPPTT